MDTLLLERRMNNFLATARSNPNVWQGVIDTLYRFNDEGIDERCEAEAIRCHLVVTESTCTHFIEGARKLLSARLRYEDMN